MAVSEYVAMYRSFLINQYTAQKLILSTIILMCVGGLMKC